MDSFDHQSFCALFVCLALTFTYACGSCSEPDNSQILSESCTETSDQLKDLQKMTCDYSSAISFWPVLKCKDGGWIVEKCHIQCSEKEHTYIWGNGLKANIFTGKVQCYQTKLLPNKYSSGSTKVGRGQHDFDVGIYVADTDWNGHAAGFIGCDEKVGPRWFNKDTAEDKIKMQLKTSHK